MVYLFILMPLRGWADALVLKANELALKSAAPLEASDLLLATKQNFKFETEADFRREAYRTGSAARLGLEPLSLRLVQGGVSSGASRGAYQEWQVNQEFQFKSFKLLASQFISNAALREELQRRQELGQFQAQVLGLAFRNQYLVEKLSHLRERNAQFKLVLDSLSQRALSSPQQQIDKEMVKTHQLELDHHLLEIELERSQVIVQLQVLTGLDFSRPLNLSWQSLNDLSKKFKEFSAQPPILFEESLKKIATSDQNLYQTKLNRSLVPSLVVGLSEANENIIGGNSIQTVAIGLSLPIDGSSRLAVKSEIAKHNQELLLIDRAVLLQKANFTTLLTQLEGATKAAALISNDVILKKDALVKKAFNNFKKGLISASSLISVEVQTHSLHELRAENLLQAHLVYLRAMSFIDDFTLFEKSFQ